MTDRLSIGRILERLGGEAFLSRLIGQVEAVAQSTDETGRPGTVTLKVKTFKPKEGEVNDGYVGFETELVPKLATPKPRKTGLYVDSDGLHTSDPRQVDMELRSVDVGQPEARGVAVGQPAARRVQ